MFVSNIDVKSKTVGRQWLIVWKRIMWADNLFRVYLFSLMIKILHLFYIPACWHIVFLMLYVYS
ncbi:hypothetical protein Avbf_16441 [Armadillidium vulgare]|nr:hypothetical protein Avbf_16441 [Armadillidium vulgare]